MTEIVNKNKYLEKLNVNKTLFNSVTHRELIFSKDSL